MCGICGEIHADRARPGNAPLLEEMVDALSHRGPDARGVAAGAGFALGACRLAIIDPDPRSDQPLANEDGTLRLVFNGEIYNFAALRARLEESGHRFRSRGDAEVVLHLYEEKGAACLDDLRGMFAFAIFDERTRTLFAARDRVGKKPFFYRFVENPGAGRGGSLLFASEIKPLLRHPDFCADYDPVAIDAFLSLGYVPGEGTAFRGIRRLPPAHFLRWKDGRMSIRRWWRLTRTPKRDVPARGGEEALAEELRHRLDEAVRLRLVSDAPLGILLSGGVDSSAVTALAAAHGTPRTFTIGFKEKDYDERPHARHTAALLGTRHTERCVTRSDASLLPRLVRHLEEPFADSSALATWHAAELASRHVKVVLNGDGGDESFAGYTRYAAHRLAAAADFLPKGLRAAAARAATAVLGLRLPGLGGTSPGNPRGTAAYVRRFLAHAAAPGLERYHGWVSLFAAEERAALLTGDFIAESARAASPIPTRFRAAWHAAGAGNDPLDRPLAVDLATYLPGDLLVKMDRMCMAHSVEARSPFLDHELIEFASRIPGRLKIAGLLGTKAILKRAVAPLLPPVVLNRRKAGFAVPIDRWLRADTRGCGGTDGTGTRNGGTGTGTGGTGTGNGGAGTGGKVGCGGWGTDATLLTLARDTLLDGTARSRGILRPAAVEALLDDHAAGRTTAHHGIFALLMLELWFREFCDRPRR